ncbi:hypothetical protein Poli38472_005931 [Pythium oligandrum]|uniref:Expansin-like EG45 domain-containing protein n=1 Tax=Pythium oligandrum TaxID=41045 RepID=A0A8K1CT59_PYTOL|nr:hypothetical protein Poli38472_005931 [Pythium oligandrum]|eukprot:TMW68463.1 hypothetical protein Poli38472_005931 [Pythium oligandrum]
MFSQGIVHLFLAALALSSLAVAQFSTGMTFTGDAKSAISGDFLQNTCGYNGFSSQFVSSAESRFAYVSPDFWSHDLPCGRCANVNAGTNASVTVMLISRHSETCAKDDCKGDLVLSPQAYRLLQSKTDLNCSIAVSWELVKCPDDFVWGGVEIAFGTETNSTQLTIQPRNFQGQIAGIEVQFPDGRRFLAGGPGQDAPGSFRAVQISEGTFAPPFTIVLQQAYSLRSVEIEVTEPPQPHQVLTSSVAF